MDYNETPQRTKEEFRFVQNAFSRAEHGLHQGIFIVTSSGKLISRIVGGWPEYDPKITLDGLRQGIKQYQALKSSDRIKSAAIPAKEQIHFGWMDFKKPERTLDLRVTKRAFAYPGMTTFDERHPIYMGIDRIWFKPSELAALFPAKLTVGATTTVTGPFRDRWIETSQMMKGGAPWDPPMFRDSVMSSKVVEASASTLKLEISAKYLAEANTQWNKGSYNGDFLAFATYNRQTQEFTKFEVAMLGTHNAGTRLSNVHAGDLSAKIATYAVINPLSDPDDAMAPSGWMYRYTLEWCRRP